jgi:hypothetical protein
LRRCLVRYGRFNADDCFKAIDTPFDRNKPLILAGRQDKHVCKLLQSALNLSHALVNVL